MRETHEQNIYKHIYIYIYIYVYTYIYLILNPPNVIVTDMVWLLSSNQFRYTLEVRISKIRRKLYKEIYDPIPYLYILYIYICINIQHIYYDRNATCASLRNLL